jgi:hypothetical protein
MQPRLYKTANLAPVIADRKALHNVACAFGEEQFKLKGCAPFMWLVAVGSQVAWIETPWEDEREKIMATYAMRDILTVTGAQAYSQMVEAWVCAIDNRMPEAERKYWTDFTEKHGVRSLPPEMRDDVLIVLSFDCKGGVSTSRYLVNIRPRGPNYLGPRMDEPESGTLEWGGRMGNLFRPERDSEDMRREAEAKLRDGEARS